MSVIQNGGEQGALGRQRRGTELKSFIVQYTVSQSPRATKLAVPQATLSMRIDLHCRISFIVIHMAVLHGPSSSIKQNEPDSTPNTFLRSHQGTRITPDKTPLIINRVGISCKRSKKLPALSFVPFSALPARLSCGFLCLCNILNSTLCLMSRGLVELGRAVHERRVSYATFRGVSDGECRQRL